MENHLGLGCQCTLMENQLESDWWKLENHFEIVWELILQLVKRQALSNALIYSTSF